MRTIKLRKNPKISKIIASIILLIFFFTFGLITYYNKKLNPKIIQVAEMKLQKFTEYFLSQNVGYNMIKDVDIDNILIINENKEGEILYVDYNIKKSYEVLEIISKGLNDLISDLEHGYFTNIRDKNIIANNRGLILKLPLFISTNNALFANLGPSIYLNINFIGAILTNISSKITDYGLNNALVELYVTIKIDEKLISPVCEDTFKIEYDVLIASKVINGRVPLAYGGIIETKSNSLSIPMIN